ncbi:hypothetical protein AALA00_10295 [Lachnospiraceae bacterium 46-15]
MNQRRKSVTAIFAILKVLALIVVIAVLVSVGRKAYDFGYRVFAEEAVSAPPGKKVAVTIEDGISVSELSELLKSKRLIKDEKVFWMQYNLSQYRGKMKGGNYILTTAMTAEEMLAEMSGANETETGTAE